MSHMDWNPDYRANLYTQDGYFEMMNVIISFLCKEMESIRPKDKEVDLLYKSANKYNWTGGAPESEIPKPKSISDEFYIDLKDPTKFRLMIDSHLADNSDLNNMYPSDFSYYIIENNSEERYPNVHLLTHRHFNNYIDRMINGLQELD